MNDFPDGIGEHARRMVAEAKGIPKGMAFDPKCLDLAQYFCPHAPVRHQYQLAQDIQELVENHDASTEEEKYLGT